MQFKQNFQGLIGAHPGGGKSVTLGTGADDPRLGTILLLDTDNKIHSIASKISQEVTLADLANPDFKLDPKGINLIRRLEVATDTETKRRKEPIHNEIKDLIDMIYYGEGCTSQINTLFFDTLSAYDHLLFQAYEKEKAASTNEKVRDNGFLTYSNMEKEILPLLQLIARMDINFIGTTHMIESAPIEGELYTVPKFSSKKLSIAVAGIFPLVCYVTTVAPVKGQDTSMDREFIFGDAYGKGLRGLHNQYEGSTLALVELFKRDEPILPLIMDGCGIFPLQCESVADTELVKTKTTKANSKK